MGLSLTPRALNALESPVKTPNLVMAIDGIGTLYGASSIRQTVRIGDGHVIGDPEVNSRAFYVGGLGQVIDQENAISPNGTSTSIKQQLDPFKGQGTSVSTLSIALLDDGSITEIITPGERVTDIMQRQTIVRFGFQGTSYPQDYVIVFRGFITDIKCQAGQVIFQLNGTDEKKRTNLFKKAESELVDALTNVSTGGIRILDTANFLSAIQGPSGETDQSFLSYIKVDDEIIQYTGIASGLTGITRGALGTTAAAHAAGAKIESFYRLKGNAVDLALKLMASGDNSGGVAQAAYEDAEYDSINVGSTEYVANSVYFSGGNVQEDYGLTVGDFVSLVSPQNSITKIRVSDIIRGNTGDFVVLDQTLADEASGGTIDFFSQWNTLPDGCLMLPDEIDIDEHLRLKRLFLSANDYDFYLKDTIEDARAFLETEIYLPLSAYSLPRKARASVGYQVAPIPGIEIVTFDETNIKDPKNMSVQRSTNTNFYNEVVYKYDQEVMDDDFASGFITISETSKARIKNSPNRSLTIESKGLRTDLGAVSTIRDKSQRRLSRYQFGAEQFSFSTMFDAGFPVEIGDIIKYDGTELMLPDIKTGERGIAPRLLEVTNKEIQLKTGDIKFTAVDTNFDGTARYGLLSPSSILGNVSSATEFEIVPSFAKRFGQAEYRKWWPLMGEGIRVRNEDFSLVSESSIKMVTTSNRVTLTDPLSFTPTPGMVMEFVSYNSARQTARAKLVYASFSADNFSDGSLPFVLL